MKIKLIVILSFIFVFSAQGQEFKEVKTGQDVIDNYLTANGGADNLKKIRSIEMTGTMMLMGKALPIKVYTSYDYFYMDGGDDLMKLTIATDMKNMTGWSYVFGNLKDATKEEVQRNKITIEQMLWGYYMDKDKYGITYKLTGNEKIGDYDTYVVEFTAGDSLLQTCNYDSKTFYRVKQLKGKTESEYSDFRNVESTGIYMGYAIKTNQGDVTVTSYKFNTDFDTKLLKKPVIKSK